jgi:putative tricarboxylic transport membrane protein
MPWVRWLPGLAALTFGLGLMVMTLRLDVDLQRNVGGAIGPDAYPGLLAGAILLLAVLLLWQTARGRPEPEPIETAGADLADAPPPAYGRVLLTLLLLSGYSLLLQPLGFLIATPLLMILLMRLIGDKRWFLMVASALLMTITLYVFFRYGMSLVLPEGLLGERLG